MGGDGNGQGDWTDGSLLFPAEPLSSLPTALYSPPYICTAKCTVYQEMFLTLFSGAESSLISLQPVSGNTGETWAVTYLGQYVMHGSPL